MEYTEIANLAVNMSKKVNVTVVSKVQQGVATGISFIVEEQIDEEIAMSIREQLKGVFYERTN